MKPVESVGMKTHLGVSHVAVTPGQVMRVPITVTNTSTVIDGVTAIVDGINPDWIRLEQPLISLFPDASADLELILDIPPTCPAGDYLVVTRVVSTISPERQAVHDFWLTVGTIVDIDLTLRPEIVSGGKSATIEAAVVNNGNATTDVVVTALEPTREIDCIVRPSRFAVPQDSDGLLDVELRGGRPWFGQPIARQIIVTVQADDVVVEKTATFNQRARIPRGLLTALTLILIVLLWALMFGWVILRLNAQDAAAKAPATAFNQQGEANVPLSNVAGTAAGTVTAATTGAGIPRVTIEALRLSIDDDGEPILLSVGSAATAEDGTFTLEALVPGRYKFCFSGDGYSEFCYLEGSPTGTSGRSAATALTVRPKKPLDTALNIELNGLTGDFVGQVALPVGGDPAGAETLSVTATQVIERPGAEPGEPVEADVDPATGKFDFDLDNDGTGDLPTPATYLITISGDNFQTQQFEQKLDAGDTPTLPKVNLAAANARLGGTVSDINGGVLGNVTVTARSGDLVVRTVTPTIGNIGTFVFTDLKTPETYVLTFERDNYASRTITRDLKPGESLTNISESLVGGSGTVTGSVISAVDRVGISDVTVKVTVQQRVVVSSTLSGGGFRIDDLPPTGTYVITVSGDGYRSETVRRAASTSGPVDVGQIVLGPKTSDLTGTISFAGTPLSGVTVSATDGTKILTTTSASQPAGFYAFAGLAPGSYAVTVDAPGLRRHVVSVNIVTGANLARNISLAGSAISGNVSFAGAPLAGAVVTLDGGSTATTDASGRYAFSNLESGTYNLTVVATGLRDSAQVAAAAGAGVTKNFILGSEIVGTVLVDGVGAGNVNVTLTQGTTTRTTTTDATSANGGRYVFRDLVAGTYTLTFVRPGLTQQTVTVPVGAGADVTKDVAMTAEIVGTVSVGGGPAADVTVTLTVGTNTSTTTTDAQGRYALRTLLAGTYTLRFERSGLTTQTVSVTILTGAGGLTRDITMASVPAAIVGTVTFGGSPAPDVIVTPSGGLITSTTTGAQGRYTLSGLVAGTYSVRFERSDLATQTVSVTIVPGAGSVTRDIAMVSGG